MIKENIVEIWKPISAYETFYAVSNFGRVKSLCNRIGSHGKIIEIERECIMHPTDNGKGYLLVSLSRNGNRKNFYVHRLVAEAFCDNPQSKKYVNHKDRNKSNNSADNLEWCTQKENVNHSAQFMRHPKSKSKSTNTGEKYISQYSGKKSDSFRVYIQAKNVSKRFKTLEDAVSFRNEVMQSDR